MNFAKKTVFITGGSRGIGKCIKENFEKSNATVIAPSRAELDLLSDDSITAYLGRHSENVDIFIHCAGLNKLAGIEEITPGILKDVFQVNFNSAVSLLHCYVPVMKQKRWGRIILINSLYGMISRERRIAYSASKNSLNGLSKTLTLELAPYGILTNCVAPGYVMTDMTRHNLTEGEISEIEGHIPTGKFQSEQEIADLVLFLSSDLNRSISGQFIAVDGGFTCR